MCGDILAPGNGSVSPDDSVYEFKVSVNFACDDGYTLIGDAVATCQANQTWDNETPSCSKL